MQTKHPWQILSVMFLICLGLVTTARSDDVLWHTDFEAAKERAKAERKLLLVVFTASDWCPYSMELKEKVFDKENFKTQAPKRFVLVEVDFPDTLPQPESLKKQNLSLRKRYPIGGYPAVFILDVEGQVVAQTGLKRGQLEKYVDHLDDLIKTHERLTDIKRKLDNAGGPQRATLLNEVIGCYDKLGTDKREIVRVGREIIALDADSRAGLKRKYTARFVSDADKLLQDGKAQEGLSLLREIVGEKDARVVAALKKLATLHFSKEEYGASRDYFQQTLNLEKELLGSKHLNVANTLRDLSRAEAALGGPLKARASLEAALEIKKAVLGAEHQETVELIEAVGNNYSENREYEQAAVRFRESLAIKATMFGAKSLPVASIHNRLGLLLSSIGDYDEAKTHYENALAIRRANLEPIHRDIANSVGNLAGLLIDRREFDAAVSGLLEGVELRHALSEQVFASASEADSLMFVKRNESILSRLTSEWRHVDRPISELYEQLWKGRGAVFQLASDRRRSIEFSLASTAQSSNLYRDWLAARREVARLSLLPVDGQPFLTRTRREQLQQATDRKEALERKLTNQLPESMRKQTSKIRPHTDLARVLPSDACFIDLVRYTRFEQNPKIAGEKGRKWTPSYAAFVFSLNRAVERIDLGPAAPIEAAAKAWRSTIISGGESTADQDLRRLVWQPLETAFSPETKTIYIVPDGPLTSLPWSALPGGKPGTVLLEDYTIAIVPNGRVLLEQLESAPVASDDGTLLAVGGVQYGLEPIDIAPLSQVASRAATIDQNRVIRWPELPGTTNEVGEIERLCGERPLIKLTGRAAGTARIIAELPKARWAVFATHGFFADPSMRSAMQLDEAAFRETLRNDRGGVVSRNPLLLSGLVFSGANLPRPIDSKGVPHGDGGILTAEAIAGLSLSKLELAILSACETGLGEVAGGEGTFGLQRAFHVAGCRNVVASLWKVDDEATAALMSLFYENLWKKNDPPLVALRSAQLTILRNPTNIGNYAARGLGAAKPLPNGAQATPRTIPARTDVRRWAAFQLSGAGK